MRAIKFRGKDVETGKWVYGDLIQYNDLIQRMGYIPSIIFYYERNGKIYYNEHAVKHETIGQYTGLKDKNGVEIYEGDIVFSKKFDHKGVLHKVEYDAENAMFTAKPIQCWDFDFCQIRKDWILKYEKEVIGNIYDNPELLKVE